jgi:excisionase family DNA binding protein
MSADNRLPSTTAFLRMKEVALRLGVSVRTLYRIVAEGKLHIVRVRRCACIAEGDLRRYMTGLGGGEEG